MTNMGAFRERGITIVRGEGSTVWDDAGNALLDVSAALWYCNIGYGRQELADAAAQADVRARLVQDLRRVHLTADRGARHPGRRARPARRRQDLLHLGRRRVDRHRREARARLLGRDRQAGQARDRLTPVRLPRLERVRHFARRDGGAHRRLRAARLRRRAGALGRRRGARGGDRPPRRRQRRGLLRRAGHRRRRRDDPARRLPRARAGDLPRARGAARPRRGDHGVRPHRRVVRDRALRALPRPDHRREGDHLRLHTARRRDRLVTGRRAVLDRGHDERLPPRLHLRRARDRLRGRAREHRRDRARGPRRAREAARAGARGRAPAARRPSGGRRRAHRRRPARRGRARGPVQAPGCDRRVLTSAASSSAASAASRCRSRRRS